MLAGEGIYLLPYLRKSFQTSMEEAFAVNAVELGLINGMFGILALACYLPGGWLADRFAPRGLLTVSLVSTSLGGFAMLATPSFGGLLALHAFWGVTSILTFWAALIKATREWGGPDNQGVSFGLLDGGRGIVAAVLVTLATITFSYAETPVTGVKNVIILYATVCLVAGVAVWVFVREQALGDDAQTAPASQAAIATRQLSRAAVLRRLRVVVSRADIVFLGIVIFCAYFLFIGTYEFPAYAERGFDQSKLFGAQLATLRDWLRPIACIAAGLLADRFRPSHTISVAFAVLIAAYAALALLPGQADLVWMLWLPVATSALAVFALRGVYFAVLEETAVPVSLTGTSVGLVSVLGYLPDVFAPALAGWFVVSFPGGDGYRMYFGLLSMVAVVGLLASYRISVLSASRRSR